MSVSAITAVVAIFVTVVLFFLWFMQLQPGIVLPYLHSCSSFLFAFAHVPHACIT